MISEVAKLSTASAAVIGIGFLAFHYLTSLVDQSDRATSVRASAALPASNSGPYTESGEYHDPLYMKVDFPGITDPEFVDVADSDLSDDTTVVGVMVDGDAYAFPREAMKKPSQHVVNAVINETPMSVTYCDITECVRVLTDKTANRPINLRVGGRDINGSLVLILDDVRYGQERPEIPLQDQPFEITSLKEWKAMHPHSRVRNLEESTL